jgi:glutamate racemase
MRQEGTPLQGGKRRPIGVFDSGVGGLTVVRVLRGVLPGEDIVYLGDTARVPYGSKSPRTVERYSLACQRFLLDRGVKLVLIACNTASATALPALAAASPVPVIGAVEPGAASALAATRGRHIGVIGTLATVRSSAYATAIAARDPGATLTALACPLLVPLAEEGWTDDEVAALVARRYLAELFARDPQIDTLVLGCTHYPLLRGVLERAARELAGRPIAVVDSATAMAEAAREAVGAQGARVGGDGQAEGEGEGEGEAANRRGAAGRLDCFATDTSRFDEVAPRFLGEPLTGFELVDL